MAWQFKSDKMISKIIFMILTTSVIIKYSDGADSEGKFLYYAYGSNLLARRLHIENPTAVFYSIAKLEGYRLDFNVYSNLWHGASATIVKDPDEIVWGDLWFLNVSDLANLDRQEGVEEGLYFAKNVTVKLPNGDNVVARTYEEVLNPPKLRQGEKLPPERRPSKTYLEVIVNGAVESNLPLEYIAFLTSFPDNGKIASKLILNQLGMSERVKSV